MDSVAVLVGQSSAIIVGISAIYKFVLVRPLEKAEERELAGLLREKEKDKRIAELTEVIKEAAQEKRERLSLPPPRKELPTLDAIKVLGYDPEEEERRRQKPLNPGRQDGVDHLLSTYNSDVSSTPPKGYPRPRKR
jgi:hypothetical protein